MNLVLLSLTTIENDLFGSVLFTICLRSSSVFNEKIIIIVLISIWYVKLVEPASIPTVVFFTAKIDD